jgi:putative heme-binding domain-containing protein
VRSLRAAVAAGGGAGDARRGQALFETQGCYGCHRVSNKGTRTGPDLTDAGALRTATELERSVVDPDASVLPEHRYVRAVARDGTVITGRRLNEDLLTVQLIDTGERLVSLSKPELREYAVQTKSAMPSYRDKLGRQELVDLVAFLASLKGGVR